MSPEVQDSDGTDGDYRAAGYVSANRRAAGERLHKRGVEMAIEHANRGSEGAPRVDGREGTTVLSDVDLEDVLDANEEDEEGSEHEVETDEEDEEVDDRGFAEARRGAPLSLAALRSRAPTAASPSVAPRVSPSYMANAPSFVRASAPEPVVGDPRRVIRKIRRMARREGNGLYRKEHIKIKAERADREAVVADGAIPFDAMTSKGWTGKVPGLKGETANLDDFQYVNWQGGFVFFTIGRLRVLKGASVLDSFYLLRIASVAGS
ncbi:hypothetical protein EV714DRAFT_277964 [Schizophyllum commune]